MYKTFFDQNKNANFVINPAGYFTEINEKMTCLTSYSREDLLSMRFYDLLSSSTKQALINCFQQALTGEAVSFETLIYNKKHKSIPIRVRERHIAC